MTPNFGLKYNFEVQPHDDQENLDSFPGPQHNRGLASKQGTDGNEIDRLKWQLSAAEDRIARMNDELYQTRSTKQAMNQPLGPQTETDLQLRGVTEQLMSRLQTAAPSGQVSSMTEIPGYANDYSQPPSGGFDDAWIDQANAASMRLQMSNLPQNHWNATASNLQSQQMPNRFAPQPQRPANLRFDGYEAVPRRNQGQYRAASSVGPFNGAMTPYPPSAGSSAGFSPPVTPLSYQSMNAAQFQGFPQRPVGTPLSATAQEFNSDTLSNNGQVMPNPWNVQVRTPSFQGFVRIGNTLHPVTVYRTLHALFSPQHDGPKYDGPLYQGPRKPLPRITWSGPANWRQPGPMNATNATYMPPVEPMNYRRLLDRNTSCNWKYIVDKIVCSNDQQASIFLQQKLKVSTPEQKFELIEAIIAQAYPLMINRFGNFLIQRCFEHGTHEQVIAIANAIRGNTLNLSMDAFGCHVVQKAFDVVPEDYKAIMVHELLRRIPETVIHRYACHVWQKLFELRWRDSPPQIMKYVNEALRGMWHEVALGETGSLVVQNIFENCLEDDKVSRTGSGTMQYLDANGHISAHA